MNGIISCLADIASIATAVVAVFGYTKYEMNISSKRKKMEDYLKTEKAKAKDKGQRSVLHLMARLGLTEAEILQSSFESKHIARKTTSDPSTHLANNLLFEYVDEEAKSNTTPENEYQN